MRSLPALKAVCGEAPFGILFFLVSEHYCCPYSPILFYRSHAGISNIHSFNYRNKNPTGSLYHKREKKSRIFRIFYHFNISQHHFLAVFTKSAVQKTETAFPQPHYYQPIMSSGGLIISAAFTGHLITTALFLSSAPVGK